MENKQPIMAGVGGAKPGAPIHGYLMVPLNPSKGKYAPFAPKIILSAQVNSRMLPTPAPLAPAGNTDHDYCKETLSSLCSSGVLNYSVMPDQAFKSSVPTRLLLTSDAGFTHVTPQDTSGVSLKPADHDYAKDAAKEPRFEEYDMAQKLLRKMNKQDEDDEITEDLAKKNPFHCDLCPRWFPTERSLLSHTAAHTKRKAREGNFKRFLCDQCAKSFLRKRSLDRHKMIHMGNQPYKCDHCDAAFHLQSRLKKHKKAHLAPEHYICDICGKNMSSKSNLNSHKLSHRPERKYVCDICKKAFKTSNTLHFHVQAHLNVKKHKCPVCPKSFVRRSEVNMHMVSHSDEKPFACSQCNKRFKFKNGLTVHERRHTNDRPYQCTKCPLGFFSNSTLTQHLKAVHNEFAHHACQTCGKTFAGRPQLQQHIRKFAVMQPLHCRFCHRKFATEEKFLAHCQQEHKMVVVAAVNAPFNQTVIHGEEQQCEVVTESTDPQTAEPHTINVIIGDVDENIVSNSVGSDSAHTSDDKHTADDEDNGNHGNTGRNQGGVGAKHGDTDRQQRDVQANLAEEPACEQVELMDANTEIIGEVADVEDLTKQTVASIKLEDPENDRRCPICSKTFKYKASLKNHMNAHYGIKPHKCTKCPKTFVSRQEVTMHMHVHDNDKLHTCHMCPARFNHKNTLVVHLRRHTGERPYRCDLCEKAHISMAALNSHKKAVHSTLDFFRCHVCGRQFVTKINLEKHQQEYSESKPLHCKTCHKKFTTNERYECHLENHTADGAQKNVLDSQDFSKVYKCTVCNNIFKYFKNLETHIKKFSADKVHQCNECHKTFKYDDQFTAHRSIHHAPKSDGNATVLLHLCSKCDKIFKSEEDFRNHNYQEHWVRCDTCSSAFATAAALNVHRRAHSPMISPCPECPETFNTIWDLECHSQTHNPPPPPRLKSHLGELHRPVPQDEKRVKKVARKSKSDKTLRPFSPVTRNFYCTVCNKKFASADHLRIHKKLKHGGAQSKVKPKPSPGSGKRNHLCDICSQSFPSAKKLKLHKVGHSSGIGNINALEGDLGQSTVQTDAISTVSSTSINLHCSVCKKTFKSEKEARIHQQIMHCVSSLKCNETEPSGSSSGAFPCDDCNLSFTTSNELRLHRVTHIARTLSMDPTGKSQPRPKMNTKKSAPTSVCVNPPTELGLTLVQIQQAPW